MSVESLLRDVVKQIEPTLRQKDAASRSHVYLRQLLNTGNMSSRITNSYLSGSYSRDTAIRPLDDVDIIFMIAPARWPARFLSSLPEPASVLATFERAIRYRYDESSLRSQRRSVRLRLNHLDIDVVPAVPTTEVDVIRIPDVKADSWIKTAPIRHSENATRANTVRGGLFKPLVKILKHWNSALPSTAQLKSFAIETMAVRIFTSVPIRSLSDGVVAFFDFLKRFSSSLYLGETYGMSNGLLTGLNVPDAAATGSNVTAGVDGDRKERFFGNATRSANRLLASVGGSESNAEEAMASVLRLV